MSHSIELSITLVSPFMTGAGGAPAFGLDQSLPRRGGLPYINGTLVRGVLRDAIISMLKRSPTRLPGVDAPNAATLAATLFGRSSGAASDFIENEFHDDLGGGAPERGALMIEDLVAHAPPARPGTLTRIAIDANSGTVREGHMQVLDLPYPIGEHVTFKGKAHLRAAANIEHARQLLDLALHAVTALGAHKSAGFGRVAATAPAAPAVAASIVEETPVAPENYASADRLCITFIPAGPFLVDAERVAANLYRGSAIIPGGVIKGAFADALAKAGLLEKYNDLLAGAIFEHAQPTAVTEHRYSCAVVPRSAVIVPGAKDPVVDVARLKKPAMLGTAAPKFDVDWKTSGSPSDYDQIARVLRERRQVGNHELGKLFERDLRTRTAIEYDRGCAFVDDDGGKLFTQSLIDPAGKNWAFTLTAPAKTDAGAFANFIADMVGLPFYFGKAKTRAVVEFVEDLITGDPPPLGASVGLVLQTPALLTPLGRLREKDGAIESAYADYFAALLKGSGLTFSHAYARQRYCGGYLAMRYREKGAFYQPHLATLMGSVFMFDVAPDRKAQAAAKISELLRSGLPVAGDFAQPHWQTCPMPRENGYGAVDLWRPFGRDASELPNLQEL
jgi:hypothetical protein